MKVNLLKNTEQDFFLKIKLRAVSLYREQWQKFPSGTLGLEKIHEWYTLVVNVSRSQNFLWQVTVSYGNRTVGRIYELIPRVSTLWFFELDVVPREAVSWYLGTVNPNCATSFGPGTDPKSAEKIKVNKTTHAGGKIRVKMAVT